MMKYEDPKLNVIKFDIADILTTSGGYVELPEDPITGSGNSGT